MIPQKSLANKSGLLVVGSPRCKFFRSGPLTMVAVPRAGIVPDASGLGVDIDWNALAQHTQAGYRR